MKLEKLKWADSIKAITKLAVIQNRISEIRVYYNADQNKKINKEEGVKKYKGKKSRDFIFNDNVDRNYFIFTLRRNYYSMDRVYLTVENIKVS
jgi:hypothetical protein